MGVTRLDGDGGRGALADVLEDEHNVLVRASSTAAGEVTASLVPSEAALDRTNVVGVSYTRSPDEWLEDWRRAVGRLPERCTVVCMGESTRSAAGGASMGPAADVTVVGENPEDLTGLGITLGEQFSTGGPTVLSFDSLTALLQYVDEKLAFRFLHSLTGRVAGNDARAHYLLDPDAHDDRTVATLTELFDATVEPDEDGWTVRTR